jgi:hypothetical protein
MLVCPDGSQVMSLRDVYHCLGLRNQCNLLRRGGLRSTVDPSDRDIDPGGIRTMEEYFNKKHLKSQGDGTSPV